MTIVESLTLEKSSSIKIVSVKGNVVGRESLLKKILLVRMRKLKFGGEAAEAGGTSKLYLIGFC